MPEWIPCYRCHYYFLPNNDKKNYKVLQFKGAIIGATCPDCSGMDKEKCQPT